jgi:[ribosomal protein S5]-alanine N-acetyltransferase
MTTQPMLQTQRLILRPFILTDAPEVQRLAGDRAVAATTGSIPHPYEDGMAGAWISKHPDAFEKGTCVTFAVELREDHVLIGAISFMDIRPEHGRAEIGYWIGKPYWGRGYATEAAAAMLDYAFGPLGLNRVMARHFHVNPASGRVMRKIGMRHEGCLRQHFHKWGEVMDEVLYGILRSEHAARTQ